MVVRYAILVDGKVMETWRSLGVALERAEHVIAPDWARAKSVQVAEVSDTFNGPKIGKVVRTF